MSYAVAYLRTSSATNVGGDSAHRQSSAIEGYATQAGLAVQACFYDAAVSGADTVDARPGFSAMLEHCAARAITTVIVETANRFSRDLIVQETGFHYLKDRGITLVAADDPDAFTADTPTATLIRQVLGAVSQFEKATTVDKLRAARDRASEAQGKRVEGRKGYADTNPELVREAKRLRRKSPKTGRRRSYRDVAAALAGQGYVSEQGTPLNPGRVKRLCEASS